MKLKYKAKHKKKMKFKLYKFENNQWTVIEESECRVANNDGFVEWNENYFDAFKITDSSKGQLMLEVLQEEDEDKDKSHLQSEIEFGDKPEILSSP